MFACELSCHQFIICLKYPCIRFDSIMFSAFSFEHPSDCNIRSITLVLGASFIEKRSRYNIKNLGHEFKSLSNQSSEFHISFQSLHLENIEIEFTKWFNTVAKTNLLNFTTSFQSLHLENIEVEFRIWVYTVTKINLSFMLVNVNKILLWSIKNKT